MGRVSLCATRVGVSFLSYFFFSPSFLIQCLDERMIGWLIIWLVERFCYKKYPEEKKNCFLNIKYDLISNMI